MFKGGPRTAEAEARRIAARRATYARRREEAKFHSSPQGEGGGVPVLFDSHHDDGPSVHPVTTQSPRKQRQSNRLTARAVETAKPGRHGDGAGLYLHVADSGAKTWVYRFSFNRRVSETGLGSARDVTLAEARCKAADARKLVLAGVSPIEARRQAGRHKTGKPTFGKCADALIAAKSSEWRNEKHRGQWRVTLETYAAPLWGLPVDEVATEAVLGVLQPVWQSIPETASRLRGRIEAVLDYAKAHGWRSGENPATWRGHLALILPKRQKLMRGHFAAMPFNEVPAFVAQLRERESIAAIALEFLILTAARSGEVLGARWSEIDLEARIWVIPATRMKSGKIHRVPLSGRAMAIFEPLAAVRTGPFVFSGRKAGLSPAAFKMLLRRMRVEGASPHGFRSSFSDWASESTMFQREVVEQCLAHTVGGSVELAYRRGDILEKRRAVLEAWADFIEAKQADNVIPLRG